MKTTDEKIKHVVDLAIAEIKKNDLRKDWRGDWFSNSQLDQLRAIFEKHGYRAARIFLEGKISKKGNRFENKRNALLLNLLETIKKLELDLKISSYLFGKLNSIIEQEIKEKKNA